MIQLNLQQRRRLFQGSFFALFVLAPPLNLLRLDLTLGHFILLGMDWTLGLDPFLAGEIGPSEAIINILLRGFAPLLLIGGLLIGVAWRYGRLYCGWLCPHFSVVEMINGLMLRASGRPTLWLSRPLPQRQPDGTIRRPNPYLWPPTIMAALMFALLWAVVLLTYLLPPQEIYANLFTLSLTPNQLRFIGAATVVLFIEFMFARHLFCRFGCAVGLFQSLAWMANDRAQVVRFDRQRAHECSDCNNACDNVCPMRLKPRTIKRAMITCTNCAQCITACEKVKSGNPQQGLLDWVSGSGAHSVVTGREQE